MQNNKLTLVVDGNWLLMSRYFMKRDTFRMDLPDSVKENSSYQLADLMAQSISVILRQFRGSITNIIFVSDNRSWRKDYPMPSLKRQIPIKERVRMMKLTIGSIYIKASVFFRII